MWDNLETRNKTFLSDLYSYGNLKKMEEEFRKMEEKGEFHVQRTLGDPSCGERDCEICRRDVEDHREGASAMTCEFGARYGW